MAADFPSLPEIARRLGGEVHGNGPDAYVTFPTPGHSPKDRGSSLRLNGKAADGFTVHSFNGYDDIKALKDDVRVRLGLSPFRPGGGKGADIVATYVYLDADGRPSRRVTRKDPKGFFQAWWAGSSWQAKGVGTNCPVLPYRLPEVIADDVLFIVEGEKDADRLAGLGYTATTNPMGAGKWKPELNRWFAGKRVFIVPDHDERGLEHAEDVARNLVRVAAEVRVLTLPLNPATGKPWKDASAWLDDIGPDRRPDLYGLAEATPLWTEPEPEPASGTTADAEDGAGGETDDAAFVRLAHLRPADYSRVRKDEADRIEIGVKALDAEVKAARAQLGKKNGDAETPPPPPDPEALARSAADIIGSRDVLELFANEIAARVAGEVANLKRLYLTTTSRLFDKPMSAAVKGESSSGKSEIRLEVLAFIPPEDIVGFTALAEKALLYYQGEFSHKILSMGEALDKDQQRFQDYLLRELISEGVLRYPVPQKIGNEIITITIEKRGPVTFMVTTTKGDLYSENETRVLSLETDDSPAQTGRVVDKIAELATGDAPPAIDYQPWHDFQRWLALGERRVVIPWSRALGRLIPRKAVRLRRDFTQLITCIKAHALLHRAHRDRDEAGRIIATIGEITDDGEGAPKATGDYAVVRELFADILAEASEARLNPKVAKIIDAVEALQPRDPKKDLSGNILKTEGARTEQVAERLEIERSAARRRLRSAARKGLIVDLEPKPNPRPSYWRTVDGAALAEAKGDFLPSVEKLREAVSSTST